jgi:hypothetical protein
MANSYDDLINQPAHRPGMDKVVNRQHAADDPRDQSGNRTGDRATPSPPTRSAFGQDSDSDPAPKSPPPAAGAEESPVNAVAGGEREAQITDYVDKAS